jgi:hypothetical protein
MVSTMNTLIKRASISGQLGYLGGRFFVQLKLYSSFSEQVHKGVISVSAKGYEALYLGINQHLSAEHAWRMGSINRGTRKAHPMERRLYDYVLFGMNTPAYFLPGSRLYTQLIPEAAKFKAIFKSGSSPIVAGG